MWAVAFMGRLACANLISLTYYGAMLICMEKCVTINTRKHFAMCYKVGCVVPPNVFIIKGMDKKEMSDFFERIYAMGAEDNKGIDLDLLRERIGQVKGIGEARLNEIMGIIWEAAIKNVNE